MLVHLVFQLVHLVYEIIKDKHDLADRELLIPVILHIGQQVLNVCFADYFIVDNHYFHLVRTAWVGGVARKLHARF
jgi:hypothetical protein